MKIEPIFGEGEAAQFSGFRVLGSGFTFRYLTFELRTLNLLSLMLHRQPKGYNAATLLSIGDGYRAIMEIYDFFYAG